MSFARHVFFMNQIYLININSFPTLFSEKRLFQRKELNDSDFGLPEERKYPMPDATHVRAAESYFRYATDQQKPELAHNILRKAKEFGVDVESPTILEWANRY